MFFLSPLIALAEGIENIVEEILDSDDDDEEDRARDQARREEAAREQAAEDRRRRIQAEERAKAELAAAAAAHEQRMREKAANERRAVSDENRRREMLKAMAAEQEKRMKNLLNDLEQSRLAEEKERRNAEAKARQAASAAKRMAEAKAEADAMSLRKVCGKNIIKESAAVHANRRALLCTRLHLDRKSKLVANIGRTGNGKSSFINAQRGILDMHPDAAKIDYLECTMEMTKYHMPNNEYVNVDVPGCGARDFLVEEYMEQMNLIGFDYLLIFIVNGRIVRDDVLLAKYAVKNGIKMAFVHSRCDQALQNLLEDCDDDAECEREKQQFIQRTNKALRNQLISWEDDDISLRGIKIYFVSSPATRAAMGRSMGQKYQARALKYALPDDLGFVRSITEAVQAVRSTRMT